MKKVEIQKLYSSYIIPESRSPYHFEKKEDAYTELQAYNPLCGDKYQLYLDDHSLSFYGIGCALSMASGSLLARSAEGLSKDKLLILLTAFLRSLDLKNEIEKELPEAVKVLASLKHFEGRIDCIKLPWQTMYDNLNNTK